MIEIRGYLLQDDKKSPYSKIENKMNTIWSQLKTKYKLEQGGYIYMKLNKDLYVKKISSDARGEETHPVMSFPAGIGLQTNTTIYIDGSPHEVRYYKTKTQQDSKGNSTYSPDGMILRNNKALTIYDKDLILFLYLFTGQVSSKPDTLPFKLGKDRSKFYFYDEIKVAEVSIKDKIKISKAIALVADTEERLLRRFAAMINIKDADTKNFSVLTSELIKSVEATITLDKNTYTLLKEFMDTYNAANPSTEEQVKLAHTKRLIKQRSIFPDKIPHKQWYYPKDKIKADADDVIYTFKGDSTRLENIIDYFIENADAYELLRERLNNL